jgi:hypothetical protein
MPAPAHVAAQILDYCIGPSLPVTICCPPGRCLSMAITPASTCSAASKVFCTAAGWMCLLSLAAAVNCSADFSPNCCRRCCCLRCLHTLQVAHHILPQPPSPPLSLQAGLAAPPGGRTSGPSCRQVGVLGAASLHCLPLPFWEVATPPRTATGVFCTFEHVWLKLQLCLVCCRNAELPQTPVVL